MCCALGTFCVGLATCCVNGQVGCLSPEGSSPGSPFCSKHLISLPRLLCSRYTGSHRQPFPLPLILCTIGTQCCGLYCCPQGYECRSGTCVNLVSLFYESSADYSIVFSFSVVSLRPPRHLFSPNSPSHSPVFRPRSHHWRVMQVFFPNRSKARLVSTRPNIKPRQLRTPLKIPVVLVMEMATTTKWRS